MSLISNANNKKDGKKGAKGANNAPGAKSFIKPGKAANFSKKPMKTGGTRGS